MAIPAIIATPGAADANSLGTYEEAVAYFAGHHNAAAWTAASEEQRKRAMIAVTRRLEREEYDGARSSSTQAQPFPRSGLSRDGVLLSSADVPLFVKYAQFEEVLALLATPTKYDVSGLAQFENVQLGPISVTPAASTGPSPDELCPAATQLLRDVRLGGSGTFRVVRG